MFLQSMVKMASGGYSAGHGFQVRGAPRRAEKVVRACGTWSVSSGGGISPAGGSGAELWVSNGILY